VFYNLSRLSSLYIYIYIYIYLDFEVPSKKLTIFLSLHFVMVSENEFVYQSGLNLRYEEVLISP